MFLSLGVSSVVDAQRSLLSSQNDGNAAQHPPVNLGSFCACATSPISIPHLSMGPEAKLALMFDLSLQTYE